MHQYNILTAHLTTQEQLALLKPLKTCARQFVAGKFCLAADGSMTDDEKHNASSKPEPYAHYAQLNDTFKRLGELNYVRCARSVRID